MQIKNFSNGLAMLTLACVSLTSFADKAAPSSYIDDEGYCVVSIHPSNTIKYVQQKRMSVPDIDDHVLRLYQTEQKISDTPLCNSDRLTSSEHYGMTDYIDSSGPQSGYDIFTTKNGDKIFISSLYNSQKEKGKRLSDTQATGRIIGGTGQLSNAEGYWQYKGTFNWKKGIINMTTMTLHYKIPNDDAKKVKS